tara:strand:+ start:11126 stop:11830 length:705 start_codon:yes stop_codon:yes gene_type:complete
MQKVKLVGEIAKFGSSWETNCANIGDIFKLIDCQTPGFRQHLVRGADAGIGYTIKRGEDYLEEGEELLLSLNNEDIIITEIPAGAKSGGAKLIAGAIIIAVSLIPGVGAFLGPKLTMMLFTVGANLAISGIAQLMAPGPETDQKQEEGYLFQGPQNNIQQGLPVPVCYGELLVGGAPISLSFRPEYTSQFYRGRGRGIVQYGMGGYYVAYNSFLNTNIPTTAVPSENNEFEVAA